jgi:hypothetical protein
MNMALFESRELKVLRKEHIALMGYVTKLRREIMTLENKLYNVYGREQEEHLAKELELTPLQKARLGVIFSAERAIACGVPEDKVLKTKEEIDKFFTVGES